MSIIEELEEEIIYLNNMLNSVESRKRKAVRALFEILAEVQAPDETSDIEEYKRMQGFIIEIVCEFLESVDD